MGESAKRALRAFRNRKRTPVRRVQGQNPSPESLPKQKQKQSNDLNSTKTNGNIDAMDKSGMNDKPIIQCPHCGETVEAARMASQRKYRNEFGLDVFECPDCHKNYKIDARKYLEIRDRIDKGSIREELVVKGTKIDELLPSEEMAIDYDRRARAPWRGPAKIIAIIAFLILAYAVLG